MVEVTGSTQDDLFQLASNKTLPPKSILLTEYQSAGRGRLDRKFIAPAGSALTFSLYVEPKVEKIYWPFLSLVTGVSIKEALNHLDSSLSLKLKWPNDLMINEKKCGGIITQATDKGVIIGIGINVDMKESELPVEHATSLEITRFSVLDRNLIAASIVNHLEINFQMWELGDTFLNQYSEASSTIGSTVEITTPDGEKIQAKATAISESGALILEDGREITVGDVIHLR